MATAFDPLNLRPELLDALALLGYAEMTPIQAQALPPLLRGVDVTGQAKTGSGKTAAFGLALLNAIDTERSVIQGLVVCPTRELADQVADELRRLARRLPNTRVLSVCGGRPKPAQSRALVGASQVVVGTPGRLGDHLRAGTLSLDHLRVAVLDEADRLLEMGFIEQVGAIIDACPSARQTLLFSATFPDEILRLSERIQRRPAFISVASQVAPERLRQWVFECAGDARDQTVAALLAEYRPTASLVFCETRDACDALTASLRRRGAVALALHGQMAQQERSEVLVQLTNGSASVLVATNVAARGLDIPALPAVIIAELSRDPESHLHRIGRTGRAGATGRALSVVAGPDELRRLADIEAFLGQTIERGPALRSGDDLRFLTPPNRTLLLGAGRRRKLRKGDVVGALVKEGGLPPEAIGRIDLTDSTCAVAVARPFAQRALRTVQQAPIKKIRVRARLLD